MTGQKYSPSTSLCLLHEHKRAYQPNMLKAISLTLFIAATAAVYIAGFVPGIGPRSVQEQACPTVVPGEDGSGTTARKAGGMNPPDLRPQEYREHQGFAGFHGYRVMEQDVVSWTGPVGSESVSVFDPDIDLSLFAGYPTYGDSPGMYGTGDDWGDGLPGAPSLMDIEASTPSERKWDLPGMPKTRKITQSPILEMAKVIYPREAGESPGTVVMIVSADRSGRLKEFDVIVEDPPGLGFAQSLKSALQNSIFFPPKVDGENVPYSFQLNYEFCWRCGKESTVQVVSGDIQVGGVGCR